MKAKSIFLLAFCMINSLSISFGQVDQYIEVISLDTIQLKPAGYTYMITFGSDLGFLAESRSIEDDLASEALFADLLPDLKRAKFDMEVSHAQDYSIKPNSDPIKLKVNLQNEEELIRLFEILKKKEGVSGSIDNVIYESADPYLEASNKKLYAKALAQATQMANISGRSLGSLSRIAEFQNEFQGWTGMYKEMMKNMPLGLFGQQDVTMQPLERKFIFRFQLL